MSADRFAQVAHPVNTGIEGDQQADQTDGGALLHRGVDGVFQRCRQRWVADVLQNFVENVLQQGWVPGQHEAGGGKGDHQDRDHRQEREIGDSRPKLIAEPVIEALCGAQQMGDHRVALHFGRRSGDGLQRLAGFLPDGGVIEGLERAFAFLRLRIRFLWRASIVVFRRHT